LQNAKQVEQAKAHSPRARAQASPAWESSGSARETLAHWWAEDDPQRRLRSSVCIPREI